MLFKGEKIIDLFRLDWRLNEVEQHCSSRNAIGVEYQVHL
jgi:hypothetical protein